MVAQTLGSGLRSQALCDLLARRLRVSRAADTLLAAFRLTRACRRLLKGVLPRWRITSLVSRSLERATR